MKKIIIFCLCVFALMACRDRKSIEGCWAMQIDGTDERVIKMPDDTIISPQIRFAYDTVYMDIKSDGVLVKSECIGKYFIKEDEMRFIDSYGNERLCKFTMKDNLLTVVDRDNPEKIIMNLMRIKDES